MREILRVPYDKHREPQPKQIIECRVYELDMGVVVVEKVDGSADQTMLRFPGNEEAAIYLGTNHTGYDVNVTAPISPVIIPVGDQLVELSPLDSKKSYHFWKNYDLACRGK